MIDLQRLLRRRGTHFPLLPFSQFYPGLFFLGQGWFPPNPGPGCHLELCAARLEAPDRRGEMKCRSHQSVKAFCKQPPGPPSVSGQPSSLPEALRFPPHLNLPAGCGCGAASARGDGAHGPGDHFFLLCFFFLKQNFDFSEVCEFGLL